MSPAEPLDATESVHVPDRVRGFRLMTPRLISVFFYGLFMDAELLRAKGVRPHHPRRASLNGFALRIGQRATLVPDPEARVHGIVMELSQEELERVYAEPGVREYRPEAIMAVLEDAAEIPALCFNLPVPPRLDEENQEYAQRLREVAGRVGLPESYVRSIGQNPMGGTSSGKRTRD